LSGSLTPFAFFRPVLSFRPHRRAANSIVVSLSSKCRVPYWQRPHLLRQRTAFGCASEFGFFILHSSFLAGPCACSLTWKPSGHGSLTFPFIYSSFVLALVCIRRCTHAYSCPYVRFLGFVCLCHSPLDLPFLFILSVALSVSKDGNSKNSCAAYIRY
jgi:hypothetical protein